MRRTFVRVAAAVIVMVAGAAAPGFAQAPVGGSDRTTGYTRWDGLYVSGNVGLWPRSFDIGTSSETIQQVSGVNVPNRGVVIVPATAVTLPATSPSATTLLAGLNGGYSREYERWVAAVEAGLDFGFGSVANTSAVTLGATALTPQVPLTLVRSASSSLGWSIRGRAGVPYHDVLFFGTAGLAGARVKLEATDTWTNVPGGPAAPDVNGIVANLGPLGPYVTTASETHHKIGFTFGFGAERAISDTLSIGAEFRHTGLGTQDFAFATPTVAINGPLPTTGSNAQALPGVTTVGFSDNRLMVRATLRLYKIVGF